MTRQTRKFITTLRKEFGAADSTSKQEIWGLLTALRGPDDGNLHIKTATTAIIRQEIFGKNIAVYVPAQTNGDDGLSLKIRIQNAGYSHFNGHAKEAFEVLGLKWDELNVYKTKKKAK